MVETQNKKHISIRLPLSSRAACFVDIQDLINRHKPIVNGNFQFLIFDTYHPDIDTLIEKARTLSAFQFKINDVIIPKRDVLYISRKAIFCEYRNTCKGICKIPIDHFNSIEDVKRILYSENFLDFYKGEFNSFIRGKEYITYDEARNCLEIKRDTLIDTIRKALTNQRKYCPIFDEDKIVEFIDNFKPTVQLVSNSDSSAREGLFQAEVGEEIINRIEFSLRGILEEAGLIEKAKKQEALQRIPTETIVYCQLCRERSFLDTALKNNWNVCKQCGHIVCEQCSKCEEGDNCPGSLANMNPHKHLNNDFLFLEEIKDKIIEDLSKRKKFFVLDKTLQDIVR